MRPTVNKYLKGFLHLLTVVLLIADAVHSFKQHKQWPTDGDMIFNVIPNEEIEKILSDPMALKVLLNDEHYLNPNRYFSHLATASSCWNMPLLLQHFTDPISSVYLSQALFKIAVQLLLIFLLAFFIQPKCKWWSAEFLLAALLVTPFFQTYGFSSQMGIIDRSTTYAFFYSLPIVFVLLFFLPFIALLNGQSHRLRPLTIGCMVLCAFVVAFSGPLNLGVAPIAAIATCLFIWLELRKTHTTFSKILNAFPRSLLVPIFALFLFCGYSLFINAMAGSMAENIPSLSVRYHLLIKGLGKIMTMKIGLEWLLILLVFNLFIIRFALYIDEGKRIVQLSRWVLVCCSLYLLLLPFGGYREYREYIIRSDTFMPVTLCLVWLFGLSAIFIIKNYHYKLRFTYYFVLAYSLIFFTQADKLADGGHECEKKMMQEVSESKEKIVRLSEPCPLIDWHPYYNYQESEKAAELLLHWNITKEKKFFYYKANETQ